MALSPQWLDELRARVTLSSVIMRTLKLQRAGREWKACCPFHEEKTPSFTVNDAKGFYHCFGCGAHGDVIRWMTDQRGMSFMDAVKELAAQAGMEVPRPDPRAARAAQKRAGLIDAMEAAQAWFRENLHDRERGAEARDYLRARGFSRRVIEEFGFGFAPDARGAILPALARRNPQFDAAMLIEGGLLISVEGKAPYDRFRGRLTLPIHDARGRVIAFGGRLLREAEGAAKYLNSPDTPLFDKGATLYNLHRAGPASRKTGRLIVVEGYMDAIALANVGIEDAVAPLGTALTERQLEMLWRLVDAPVLCFDGDAAGQRAAMRAIERAAPLLGPARSLRIATLPPGKDPDDVIRESGREAMVELLGAAVPLVEWLWRFERDRLPLETPEDKAGLKARLAEHIDRITDQEIRALYRRELFERFSAFAFPPRAAAGPGSGFARNPPSAPSAQSVARLKQRLAGGARDELSRAVIHGLLRFPEEIARHSDALARLARLDPRSAPMVESLFEIAETLDFSAQMPISGLEGLPAPPENLRFAFLREGPDPVDAREELAEAVALLVEKPAIEAAIAATIGRFDEDPEGAFAEQHRLRTQLSRLNERLKNFGRKRAASAATPSNSREPADQPKSDLETD